MAAQLIDENELLDNQNQTADDITDETSNEATPPVETKPPEEELPEKYRGKSALEIAKMHQEAEKLIGRQAQEVGEVRKLADELIKQQLNTTKQDTQPSVEDNEIDYFANPDKAVNHAVENNPVVKQLKEQAELQARQQVVAINPS